MAKSKGKTGLKGYLYGKDCWDFQNFAVFVEPNHYLFCLHPRAEMLVLESVNVVLLTLLIFLFHSDCIFAEGTLTRSCGSMKSFTTTA